MKGVIVLPTAYKGSALKAKTMYAKFCKKYNFSLIHSDTPELDSYDVAIIMCIPYHSRPGIPPGLLNAKCKLIGHFGDLQCYDSKECAENKKIMFDRYDLLIGTYYEKFKEWHPEHVYKYIHWPQYFAPYERYMSLPINPNPRMKCIMIGSYGGPAYPCRKYVARSGKKMHSGLIEVKGPWKVPFDKYPKYISNWFCGLALANKFNFPETKHFEIPAAGLLMLAREIEELEICGFKPNVHYVPVTKKNVFDQVRDVLAHPKDYMDIKNRATKFVRKNHSDVNRVDDFEKIFDRLGAGIHEGLLRKS